MPVISGIAWRLVASLKCWRVKGLKRQHKLKGKVMTSSSGIAISPADLLLLIFITLKLCGVIGWSWWWVLSPLWIKVILVLLVAL